MGNSSTKEARPASALSQHSRHEQGRTPTSPGFPSPTSHDDRAARIYGGRSGRGSRHDLSFLASSRDAPTVEPVRRETKAEREARRLEKERILREKERERSMREENVDGGFLVTLGTYIGPEDFSKPVVRQLMIERRIAPFWKGLNDHSDSWLDHQLIAAVQDKPIPAADDIPTEESNRAESPAATNPRSSDLAINTASISHLTVPISSRSQSTASDQSILSPSHPAFSSAPITLSTPFRSRARSLVGLSSSKNNSQVDIARQEINLPNDLYINGHRLEAFLYKNASECPICFLYYPPYLNKTRCCDQPICSECFVQIKRPDPHPPEHHEPNSNTEGAASNEQPEDNQLVSEPAACPFCVQPEFGVTYEAPPFRRGLVYSHTQGSAMGSALGSVTSAMSSTTSLNSPGAGRRRTTSLSANCSSVISTDRVRPDWAKKLADARANTQRRAAAATALHNAAYVLGQSSVADARGSSLLGRRRRTIIITDSPGGSGNGTPRLEGSTSTSITALFAAAAEQNGSLRTRALSNGQSDQSFDRQTRRNRLEDLEDLMMMEAIRLSLAAEEERKRKEEKDMAKEAKKEEKKRAKEAKKASRKSLFFGAGPHEQSATSTLAAAAVAAAAVPGKGKSVDRGGSVSPPSISYTANGGSSRDDPQRHLEQSRARISPPPFVSDVGGPSTGELGAHRDALRQLSVASSSASSLVDSIPDSLHRGNSGFGASNSSFEASPNVSGLSLNSNPEATTSNSETPGTEPMFNFRSLAAVIGSEDGEKDGVSRIEDVAEHQKNPASKGAPAVETGSSSDFLPPISFDSSSGLEQSVVTIKPSEGEAVHAGAISDEDDSFKIEPVPVANEEHDREFDQKHYGVEVLDSSRVNHHPTQ